MKTLSYFLYFHYICYLFLDKLLNIFEFNSNKETRDMECYRLVKSYDKKNIEIAGINLCDFQIGKIGISPQIIYAATQFLFGCISI